MHQYLKHSLTFITYEIYIVGVKIEICWAHREAGVRSSLRWFEDLT